ncbi:MAG: helicase-related protein [Pseudomonadota bacterium]|nr:helicase-related protein [Pseudomonadota bacterium]
MAAVLGPTNTGKTHYAMERMLAHATGMIGFPLRLLARENYDQVVKQKGLARVALVTGEEKIVPPRADYFICTVESMPLDREVEFLAIDEIQMCADPERGHVFTDRLLRARGVKETLFLGADTIRHVIERLVPEADYISRPRLSKLTYVGPRKITRLPRHSAVVAFSVNEVYAIAELMRRQRGGTAVVLGALSPRTRNAQVEMYQGGEVDYLVATDAIGMGLNMNIDHVAFAGARKFDGRNYRHLTTSEIAQIAGRAGRHMSDGTFGPIVETGSFDDDIVSAIENHSFQPLTGVFWRNGDLDFRSATTLLKSLEMSPYRSELRRARESDDKMALTNLLLNDAVVERATTPAAVRLLWEICQIPDFRKTMADVHANFLGRLFLELTDGNFLPTDWVADQVAQLDRVDGDIDTLMARIAHVRTWTYISHRADWLKDAKSWQSRTHKLEDKISDALHNSLTQRFVDRRAAALTRMKDGDDYTAVVGSDGDVDVGGEFVGHLEGFRFVPDSGVAASGRQALLSAANKALRGEIDARINALCGAPDTAFSVDEDGVIIWSGAMVARLEKGAGIISPQVFVLPNDYLSVGQRERLRNRLINWVEAQITEVLERLIALGEAKLDGMARGLAYRIVEGLGSIPRLQVIKEVRGMSKEDRSALRSCGVRIGPETLFLPMLVKPKAVKWRALLWTLFNEKPSQKVPGAGLVTVQAGEDADEKFLAACGFACLGKRAIRVDVLDRIAVDLQRQSRAGKMDIGATQLNLLGLSMEDARPVFEALGYVAEKDNETLIWKWGGRPKTKSGSPRPAQAGGKRGKPSKQKPRSRKIEKVDEDSPFAKLRELKLS